MQLHHKQSVDTQGWMSEIREFINSRNPELSAITEVYINEAIFGRQFIDGNLSSLAKNSKILEVGAGSLLLSIQLVREGYDVTSLEPVSVGFSHFAQMQLLVLEFAELHNIKPKLLNICAENLMEEVVFDFAFSINVMEHVEDIDQTIKKVVTALKPGAYYRFTCPNYSFPYEPHFNIPTLFNKKLTEAVFKGKIYNNPTIADPTGLWKSLNWITTRQVKKIVRKLTYTELDFNKKILECTLQRLTNDAEFSSRRSPLINKIANVIVLFRFHKLLQFVPLAIQPIIDCTITRNI